MLILLKKTIIKFQVILCHILTIPAVIIFFWLMHHLIIFLIIKVIVPRTHVFIVLISIVVVRLGVRLLVGIHKHQT